MNYWKDFLYVDARYDHASAKKPMTWIRIPDRDVQRRIITPARASNCFTTVQRFKDATSLLELSRETEKLKKKKAPTPTQKDRLEELIRFGDDLPEMQVRYHGLFFDFDCDYEKLDITMDKALARSRADAAKLANWFIEVFDLNPAHVQCWFSGKKGFHVLVRPEPFGIVPHQHLTLIIKVMAFQIADELDLKTMDRTVYSKRRMWRIPNTTNPKTGKFKIELTVSELNDMSIGDIIQMAEQPRDEVEAHKKKKDDADEEAVPGSFIYQHEEYLQASTEDYAGEWYREHYMRYEAYRDNQNLEPRRYIKTSMDVTGEEEYPDCVADIIKNGLKEDGADRNRMLMPLAGFLYDSGQSKKTSLEVLHAWTNAHFQEPPSKLRERLANATSVVNQAYGGGVHFACRFIRGCGGKGDGQHIKCVTEDKCDWIKNAVDQEPAAIPLVHLSEATRGCYEGTKIRTAVHVATIARGPFMVPKSGKILCSPDATAKICEKCVNNDTGAEGKLQWTLDDGNREVLAMVSVNDNEKKGTIKAMCKIPKKCFRHVIEIEVHTNIEEVQLIPMVDFAHAYMTEEDANKNEGVGTGQKSARHVVRMGYHMGFGIEANKKYIIEPTVQSHPKSQLACFVFDKLEPAQNDIDQFRLTPELIDSLRVFQPKKGQSVVQKFMSIHRDLMVNVHQIGGRVDLSIAIDLCYHSIIAFNYRGQPVNRGYFELVVIGDTGTGKSTMVQRMMGHYGLGELIAGEDSKRTGLVYSSTQVHGQWVLRWGKIPQNDRRLLVIDEFGAMSKEEIGKLTQMRSEGKARGGGVNADYETYARTRLICMSNPRDNQKPLAAHAFGITAVRGLYPELQDLRRVDFAVAADATDVKSSLIYLRWDKVKLPHVYTADLCRNLVLWAWSREPRHVVWEEGVVDEVISKAKEMGDTYQCDYPLAEKADLDIKIARISVAVAARMFSTDEEGQRVIVKTEHVVFAHAVMDRAYRKRGLGFFRYAKQYKLDNYLSENKKKRMTEEFDTYGDETSMILKTLHREELINKHRLSDMLNLKKDEMNRLWRFIVRERLIVSKPRGYETTKAFTQWLGQMEGEEDYKGELPDDFETGGSLIEELLDAPEDVPAPIDEETQEEQNRFFANDPSANEPEHDEPEF